MAWIDEFEPVALTNLAEPCEWFRRCKLKQDHDLLALLKEWIAVQEARPDGMPNTRQAVYWEPSMGAIEPSVEVEGDHPSFHSVEIPPYTRSLARRVFRTLGYGLTVIVIGGAVSAWYSSDDNAKGMVEASLRQLSSIMGATSSANSDVQSLSKSSDHALGAIGLSGELENRLETVVNDLAVMRRTAEQLAAKQEAMARDIAVLQAVERILSVKSYHRFRS